MLFVRLPSADFRFSDDCAMNFESGCQLASPYASEITDAITSESRLQELR